MAATGQNTGRSSESDKLNSYAASAALISAREAKADRTTQSVLDEDGKLSSASAATSLKYARAQDLPSFPSAGLSMSSAGAAASLADSNKKSFEHWKPSDIPAANKAALLAKDYEMDPMWQPGMSAAGSKAAILAHQDGGNNRGGTKMKPVHDSRPPVGKPLTPRPINTPPPKDTSADSHRKALLAATGAMSGSRRRAGSAPAPAPPKQDNSWAMKAANKSHNEPALPSFASGDPGFEAARIQNIARGNVNRQMYGSTPPVDIEVQEKNRQDMLKASAVAMAQKMYAIQQKHIDDAAGAKKSDSHAAATKVRSSTISSGTGSMYADSTSPPRYENLEEAARRLAQERLAKLHDEHAEYRNYYGQTSPQRARLSTRLRRRASSGTKDDDSDEEQSRKIKSQMSLFHSKLAEVDSKKRQADRDALLEAAHRNVDARMRKMDDKVFQETGKASPAQMEMWEKAAREKAQRESDARMQNMGKVHIGGGQYIDQSEVNAIAKARLQPTLDDITEKAEKQRARDEEIRLDQERVKAEAEKEKKRQADVKAELKAANEREKLEEKSRKAEEKRLHKEQTAAEKERRQAEITAEKERKQAEAAAEKERARLERDEKRKSKEQKGNRLSAVLGRSGPTNDTTDTPDKTNTESQAPLSTDEPPPVSAKEVVRSQPSEADTITKPSDMTVDPEKADAEVLDNPEKVENDSPASPSAKGPSRVKSLLKKAKEKTVGRGDKDAEGDNEQTNKSTLAEKTTDNDTDYQKSTSMHDVAMAGRTPAQESEDMYASPEPVSPPEETAGPSGLERSPSISSISHYSADEQAEKTVSVQKQPSTEESRGRKGFRKRLLDKISHHKDKGKESEHDTTASKIPEPINTKSEEEAFDEARDTFKEERLAPPPPLSAVTPSSPRGSRERSRFKEDL